MFYIFLYYIIIICQIYYSQSQDSISTALSRVIMYTLKTGIPVDDGDFILKLLRRVSCPEIQLGVGIVNCNGIYFSSQEQIAYFLTQEAVYPLVHFKFLRVYSCLPFKRVIARDALFSQVTSHFMHSRLPVNSTTDSDQVTGQL